MQDNQKVVTGCLKTLNLVYNFSHIFAVFLDFRVDLRSDNDMYHELKPGVSDISTKIKFSGFVIPHPDSFATH